MTKAAAIGLVGVVVGLVVGIGTREGLASQLGTRTHGGPAGAETLRLITKAPRELQVIDVGRPGHSHGDIRVLTTAAYDASGTRRVGDLHSVCLITAPADRPGETLHVTQCTVTYRLPAGQIMAQYVTTRPTLTARLTRAVAAITGGTGAYDTVRGQLTQIRRGEVVHDIFHLHR